MATERFVMRVCATRDVARLATDALLRAGFVESDIRATRRDGHFLPIILEFHLFLGALAGAVIGATVILMEALQLLAPPFVVNTSWPLLPDVLLTLSAQLFASVLIGAAVGGGVVLTLWQPGRGPLKRGEAYIVRVRASGQASVKKAETILSEWSIGERYVRRSVSPSAAGNS